MQKIDWERRNPQKQQVSGPTIAPEQIKKSLGVKLTKHQAPAFELIALGQIAKIDSKVEESLIRKNLVRRLESGLALTARGKEYAKLKGLVK